ncbi:MAG: prolyl oligopeptidase family serine peptidase [Pseudomonadota bacterium]|nr:prolyl oligopeptidase family serine peptidase [Pseudomonadota bacterium]
MKHALAAGLIALATPAFAVPAFAAPDLASRGEADSEAEAAAPKPAAVVADGIPPVPQELVEATRPYFEYRTASFSEWDPETRAMFVATRFGDTTQLHRVAAPGAARSQLTFEAEPIRGVSVSPGVGDVKLVSKDIGGNEFYQIYRLVDGRLELLTDGTSRNGLGAWMDDGSMVAFSSTRRNGRDTDLYLMDPRDPSTTRMLAQREGGGWFVADFTPDGGTALVGNYISVTEMELYEVDVASGAIDRLTPEGTPVAFSGLQYAPDGRLWVASDHGAEFKRLGIFDRETARFEPLVEEPWDIVGFDISEDGGTIAYEVNAAGQSQLKLYDVPTGEVREVALPPGTVGGIEFAPWGELGFTLVSNRGAADAYSVDPATLELTRWTTSEMGGLDPEANVLPSLVEIESFDGEAMSGFLYMPDPARHPGPRPLLVNIHGGPEGQSTATFLGRNNYLINEQGIAIFYPNVRGSTGFGKRFVGLDNGPFRREDSVRDIGAFLDRLEQDPRIDAQRIGVTGGSYGGYMCYASAIAYGDRLRGANCIVAISDFVTFLENTQDYRRDLRRVEYGDERDPRQRAKLKEISPLTRADQIRIPLMVATGANDPRVPASEADQIIAAVRANGREAWHFLAQNEGHGFAKKENADYFLWSSILFWQRHLLD